MQILSGSAWVQSHEVYVDSLNRLRCWQQNRLMIFISQSQSQVLVELTLGVSQWWSYEPDPQPPAHIHRESGVSPLSTCKGVIILLSLPGRAGHHAASRNISGILPTAPKGLKSHMLQGVLLPQRTKSSHEAKSVHLCGQAGFHGPLCVHSQHLASALPQTPSSAHRDIRGVSRSEPLSRRDQADWGVGIWIWIPSHVVHKKLYPEKGQIHIGLISPGSI